MNASPLLALAGLAIAYLFFVAPARASIAPAGGGASSGPRVKWTPPAAAAPYLEAIGAAELAHALPAGLLARTLYQESHFRADVIAGDVVSSAGAIGIAQFEPATAADYGVDPYDAESSIEGMAHYLADLYARFGDWTLALIAYNWGQGNLTRKGIGAAPAESRAYAAAILGDLEVFG